MRVVLDRWGRDDELKGRVLRVEPAGYTRVSALGVDEQRVPVRVEITSPRDEWPELGDAFRVEARFILWEGEDVVQVPSSALFRRDDHWAVFVVEDEQAALKTVKTGRRSGLWTQVTEGLSGDEVVITHPGDRIESGVGVEVDLRDYQ